MALVQWLKDNPIMSQYIVGGLTPAERLELQPKVPLSREHQKFVRMQTGRSLRSQQKPRPRTLGDQINSAPDLRAAYPIDRLSEESV